MQAGAFALADIENELLSGASSDIIHSSEELPAWLQDYLMTRRQTLIMELGALEDLLGMERSIVPRRKRYRQPNTCHR